MASSPVKITHTGKQKLLYGFEKERFTSHKSSLHNTTALLEKHYLYVGKLIAMSLTEGGPGPACFCQWVYNYLTLGFDGVKVEIADIPDIVVQEKLKQVSF